MGWLVSRKALISKHFPMPGSRLWVLVNDSFSVSAI